MDEVTFRSYTVLSDVHLLLPNACHLMSRLNSVGQPVFLSRFRFLREELEKVPSPCEQQSCCLLDEDGDLDVERKPIDAEINRYSIHPVILSQAERSISEEEATEEEDDSTGIIKIEHTMATTLEDVGKQVWRGAFLLSDFILSNPSMFCGATVLELGAGTGLTSIVMASMAKRVYCTDVGDDLLSMCQRNVQMNEQLKASGAYDVKVRQLDWTADNFFTDTSSEFSWSEEEISDLHDNTTFITAADVFYDKDLTDALFRTLYQIVSNLHHPSTAYFCIEKRLNFTLRHMDISCEAYNHFRHCLEQLKDLHDGNIRFTISPVPCSFPQLFQYERVDQLELWKVMVSTL